MGRIHNLNRHVGKMGLFQLLLLTRMPTRHKNKYSVKCRYGKYFLCVANAQDRLIRKRKQWNRVILVTPQEL